MLGQMEASFLATDLRKLLLWLTLEFFRRNSFENRSIRLVGLIICRKNERNGCGLPESGGSFLKIRACFARATVCQNLPSRNPGSATGSGNIVYNELSQTLECGITNQIAPFARKAHNFFEECISNIPYGGARVHKGSWRL